MVCFVFGLFCIMCYFVFVGWLFFFCSFKSKKNKAKKNTSLLFLGVCVLLHQCFLCPKNKKELRFQMHLGLRLRICCLSVGIWCLRGFFFLWLAPFFSPSKIILFIFPFWTCFYFYLLSSLYVCLFCKLKTWMWKTKFIFASSSRLSKLVSSFLCSLIWIH